MLSDVENNSTQDENTVRDYISSPGYDTSSSNAPTSSPDPCEYTYEGAIQDYKSRVLRASSSGTFNGTHNHTVTTTPLKSEQPTRAPTKLPKPKLPAADIEYRLNAFEANASAAIGNDRIETIDKKSLPKIDIVKRREMFEKEAAAAAATPDAGVSTPNIIRKTIELSNVNATISIRDRVSSLENREDVKDAAVKKLNRLSGEFNRVKDRLSNIESPIVNSVAIEDKPIKFDVPVVPLKDRLYSLQSAAFDDKNRDGATKKLNISIEQKIVSNQIDQLNGNGNENTKNYDESIVYNVITEQSFIESKSNGIYATNELLLDLSDINDDDDDDNNDSHADCYIQLEAIQEEREEQYNVPANQMPILAKKPEVMPRTRNITPDPPPKVAIITEYLTTDYDQEQQQQQQQQMPDEIASDDVNDDGDVDDDSVSVQSTALPLTIQLLKNDTTINNSHLENNSNIDCSNHVVMVNNSNMIENENNCVDNNPQNSLLTIQSTNSSQNSILDSNHNLELDNMRETVDDKLVKVCEPSNGAVVSAIDQNSTINRNQNDKINKDEFDKQNGSESSISKNERIKCQIVGVLEKHKKPIDSHLAENQEPTQYLPSGKPLSPTLLVPMSPNTPRSPKSPKSPKSPSKTKNIFDFIKRNLLNDATADATDNGHSDNFQPIKDSENAKKEIDFTKSSLSQNNEIDQLLDEELSKLSEDELQ